MDKSKAVQFSNWIRDTYPVNSLSASHRKLVSNLGINDATYVTQPVIDDRQIYCPAYVLWRGMLKRVYGTNNNLPHPAYNSVSVCEEWLTFSNFRDWWVDNHIDGYQLDKDMLFIGNKLYSPYTCIYVPQRLNAFITDRSQARGNYKIGVTWHKKGGKFLAKCCNIDNPSKKDYLGYFKTEHEAYEAWLKRKLELALELKQEMDAIDLRIYPNVVEIIKNIK